jgi:solute carrier family 8 (sodium/calcium exchanger)
LLTRPLPLLPPPDGHDRKFSSDEEEAKRIAEMGKPVLGEFAKMEVIIEESYEFKVGNVPVRTGQNH